jgi:hypothetical protein
MFFIYKIYLAGSHLHLTGEIIAHSFLSSAKDLSTTFLSSPVISATLPALMGSQALFIASKIIFFSFSILMNYNINLIFL